MQTSDFDILIVPGWLGSDADHWQSRWARELETAKLVEEANWAAPDKTEWVGNIVEQVRATSRPTVFVAHSVGVVAVVHAALRLPRDGISGAFLVSLADVENADRWPVTQGHAWPKEGYGFKPIPRQQLPFPAVLISSSDDPYCRQSRAREFAVAWGCDFENVGPAGHITTASGYGPWPAGLSLLSGFLGKLRA